MSDLDPYMTEAVRQLREEYGDGPEVPDAMIANTLKAHLRACDIAAVELGWVARRRYQRARARFDRRQRHRLAEAVRRHFMS